MKCAWCGNEKSYFGELYPIPLTEEQRTYPVLPQRSLVCGKCLGWEKTKIKLEDINIFPNNIKSSANNLEM